MTAWPISYGDLQTSANIIMHHLGTLVTFEFTKSPIELSDEMQDTEVQIYVDGEPVSGWILPQRAHDWLLGVTWAVQYRKDDRG